MKMFKNVMAFHQKFNLPTHHTQAPGTLPEHLQNFRTKFMQEELDEFESSLASCDIEGQIDGLLDLIYVAHGTLHMMGLTPEIVEECWDEIQRANMSKVRAEHANDERSKRKHSSDVVKPEGWVGPDLISILKKHGVQI